MQRIASIIQEERDWHGSKTGYTLSPRAIDKADEDSIAAVTQYGVRFHLCASPWRDDQGIDHLEWYIKRVGKWIPTRINLARDPVSDELLAAFGLSLEEALNRIAQVPREDDSEATSEPLSDSISEAVSEQDSEQDSGQKTRWEFLGGNFTVIDAANDPEFADTSAALKAQALAGTDGLIKCDACGEYTSPGLECSACGTYIQSPSADGPEVRAVAELLGVNLDSVPVSVRSTERELPLAADAIRRTALYEVSVSLSPYQCDKLALVIAVGGGVIVQSALRDGYVSVLLHAHGEQINHRFILSPAGELIPESQDVSQFGPQSLVAVANAPDNVYDSVRQRAREEVYRRLEQLDDKPASSLKQHKELEAIITELEKNDCELVAAAHEPCEEPFWTVLALRRRPVFPDKPYVVWDSNYSGLSNGHYDLDRFAGFRRFNQHVAEREEV